MIDGIPWSDVIYHSTCARKYFFNVKTCLNNFLLYISRLITSFYGLR